MYDESFDFQQYLELLGYDREEIPEEIPEEVKIGLYKRAVLDLYNSSYKTMGDHPLITPSQKKDIVLNNIVSNVPYARQALGIPDLVEDESEPYRLQGLQNFLHQRVSEEFLSSDAKRYVKEYSKTIINDTTPFVRPFMGDTTKEEYIEGLYDANGLYEGMTVQDILEVNADLPPLERERKGADGAMAYSVDQAQKLTGKAIQGVGDAFNIDWMSDFGRGYAEKQDREMEEGGYQPKYTKSLRDTFNEDGLFASVGKVFEMSLESWALTGLGLAGAAVAPFGGIVGGTGLAVSAGTAIMGGIGETVEEWEEKGVYDKEENAPLALAVGLAAASIDFLGNLLGMSVGLTKGLFGKAAKEGVKDTVAGVATKAATSAAGKAVGKKAGGEAVKNMFTKPELREWGTELMLKAVPAGMTEEVMQEATFIGSAILQGAEYESSEVLDRFLESGVVGGAMSGAVKTGQLATRQTLGTLFPQPEKADDAGTKPGTGGAGTKPGTGGAVAPTPLKIGTEMNNAMVTKTIDGHIINFAGRSAFGTTLQDAVDALNRSANRGKATLDPDSIKTNPEGTVASVEFENGTVTVEGDSAKADLAALVDMHNRNDNPFMLKEGTTIKKTTVPNPNDPAGTPQTSYSVTSPTGRTIVGSNMVALFESLEADVSNVGNMLMDISEEKIDTKPAEVTVDLDTPLQGPKLNEDQVRKDLESQGFFVLFPKGVGPAKDRKTGEVKRTDGRVTLKRFSAYKDGIIYDVSVHKVKGSTTATAKVSARSILSDQKIKLDSDIETQTLRSGADSTTLTNKIKLRRPRVGVEVRATKVAGRNVYNIPTEIVERVAESVNGTVSQESPTHATVTTGDGSIINFNIDEDGDVLVTVGGVTHKVKGNLSFFDPSRLDINVQSVLNVGLQGGAFEPVGTTIDKDLLLIRRKTRSGQNIDLVIDRDGRVGALTKDDGPNVALKHIERFGPTATAPVSQPQMAPEPPRTAQKVIESADKGQVSDQHQLTDTEQPGVILAITEDMDVLVDLDDVREAYGDQYMRGFVRINEDGHYLSDDGALYTSDINQAMIFYPSDIADQVPEDMVEVHVLMNPDHSPALVSTSESRFVSEANTHTGIIDPMYNSVQYSLAEVERQLQITEEQRQYDEVVERYKGTDQWLKAPNGKQSNLNERQWVQVRTESFKKWFGDWENDSDNASKVVDDNGEPLVVYHGTSRNFNSFEMNQPAFRAVMFDEREIESQGAFFSESEADARSYGRNVMPVYLSVQNPFTDPADVEVSSRDPVSAQRAQRAWEDAEYILQPLIYEGAQGRRLIDYNNGISAVEVDPDGEWVRKLFPDGKIDWDVLDNPDVVARMKERGYDGSLVDEPNDDSGTSWFVVRPEQIKSATGNTGAFDASKPDVRYAGTEQPTTRTNTVTEELSETLESSDVKSLVDKGLVTIVGTQEEAKGIIGKLRAIKYSKDGKIQGFYVNGKAYLVEDGIGQGEAMGVLMHELGEHALKLGFISDTEYQEILSSLEARQDEDSDTGKAIRKAMQRVPANTAPEHYWSEVAAYLVQHNTNQKLGIVDRLISLLKKWLFKAGNISADKLTHKDLVAFAYNAILSEARGVTEAELFSQANTRMVQTISSLVTNAENFPVINSLFEHTNMSTSTPVSNVPGLYVNENGTIDIVQGELVEGWERRSIVYGLAMSDGSAQSSSMIQPIIDKVSTWQNSDNPVAKAIYDAIIGSGELSYQSLGDLYRHLIASNVADNPVADPDNSSPRAVHRDLIDLVASLISARTNIASNGLQLTKGDIQVYLNGLSDQAQSTDPTEQPLAREEKTESIENTAQLTSESSEPASEHVVPFRTLGDILNDEIVQSFSDLDETLGQRLNLDGENAVIEGETNIEVRGDKNNAAMTMDRVLSSTQDTDAIGAGVLSESVRDMLRDNPDIDLAQMNPTLDDIQPFLDLLPSFIRDRIKIHTEETKQAKRIFGKSILGLFYSFLADKHIIHIKAYDRNLAEVISTIAHEVGHFGQQMWENIDILKVKTRLYDILVFDIMKKLPHYYKNNNIVRGRETRYEKGMLIDEYFAHYGLSFVDFNASAFPSGIVDLAVLEDIKKELDGEVAKLRNDLSKIFVSKSGIPKVAEGFIEDIIRATVGVTVGRGTQFSYSVDDPLTGKATVHVYTNDYGQIYDSVPEEHSALIRKQILDKYNSLTGFRKKLFKFRINNFKIPGSYWGDTVIGSKGSLMLSRIQQIAAVDYTVELRTVAQNHRELEAILHDNNIDAEVARSEGYESTFRRLGLKGKRQIELAQIADQFLVDGQTTKYKNVINIRRLLNLTSSKLADWMKASGVPQKNIDEMMAQFRNLSKRFVSDWDHRMYSAHTEEGLADLREMLAHLKANPNSDTLLSEQAEAAENAIAELEIKLVNKQITGQQFRKAVQPHNKVLRYKKRLDALRYYKTIQLIQKTPRGQEQFRIAQQSKVIHEAMVNEINTLINSVTNHRTDGDGRDKLGMYSAMHKRKLNEHLVEDQKYMEFLEEITDPFKVMIHNLDQQAKIINKLAFNIEFGEYLLTNGMAWMKNAPLDTRAGDTKIGFMEVGSFLNYIKVEPFFADHIKMEHEVNQALTENFAANIIALAKSHMTIYSIRQLVNNYVGNISVMMMGGHLLRFNQFRNASDVAAKQIVERFRYNTATMDEFKEKILRELREHRVFGGSSAQTEIMMYSNNVYEKVIGGFADIMADMGVMTNRSARNIRKKISNFINKVQEVYGYGDEWIKPLIYLNNREIAIAKYEATLERRQGESDASYKNRIEKAAVEEAARRTQMETTTWELAPMVIRKASNKRLRLIVPDFLLHNFQMLRITATQLSRLAELRQDIQEAGKIGTPAGERYLKALKSELYQRSFGAAGMSTIFALFAAGPISIAPTMLSFMASMAGGKGDDDEDDRKTADSRWYFTPTEHRSSQALLNFITGGNTIMVPIVRGEDRFKIVATNAVRQHAAYTLAPVRPATESPSVWDWGVALSQNVMDLSQEPLTMQVINSVRGKNQWGDDVGIVNAVNALASRIMVPNALKTTLGVVAGYDLDRDDKVHRMHKAFDFVGANVREYDIRDIMARLAYKVKDERNSQNNHRRRDFVKGLVDGDLMTDKQISGQIRSMMDAHERAMGDVNYVLDGARTLLTRQEMATYMYHRHKNGNWTGKETGLSRADINGLLNGQNIFDRGLITTLQNERKKLTKGAAGVKMDTEQRRIAIQNLTRAIQRYQQAIK